MSNIVKIDGYLTNSGDADSLLRRCVGKYERIIVVGINPVNNDNKRIGTLDVFANDGIDASDMAYAGTKLSTIAASGWIDTTDDEGEAEYD